MRLNVHDLNDIKLRRDLRRSRPEDLDALLDELEAYAEDMDSIALALDASLRPEEILTALQDRLADEEDNATELREREVFEEGAFAVSRHLIGSPELRDLFARAPLALPDEYCRICQIGHADEYGGCDHGKKVRGAWAVTLGPTQTGAILVILALPVLDLICQIRVESEIAARRRTRARVADAQRLAKYSKSTLLEMAQQRKVVVSATDTKAQIADRLSEVM